MSQVVLGISIRVFRDVPRDSRVFAQCALAAHATRLDHACGAEAAQAERQRRWTCGAETRADEHFARGSPTAGAPSGSWEYFEPVFDDLRPSVSASTSVSSLCAPSCAKFRDAIPARQRLDLENEALSDAIIAGGSNLG